MLLGAVMQVALHASTFRVATRDDAGSRGAQFVGLATKFIHRTLKCRVELRVMKGESDLSGEVREHSVIIFTKRHGAFDLRDHDDAEEFSGVADGRDAQGTNDVARGDRG